MNVKKDTLIAFAICHLLACLAFIPWFFSWTGVVLLVVGMYVFGILGINLGFHRLIAHRGFKCPIWLEHMFALLGTCCLQFSPAFWVAVHRRHHRYTDEERDPHSPRRSFFWAHFGWLLARRPPDMKPATMTEQYARDVMRDPLYARLERRNNWAKLGLLSWLVFFAGGFAAAMLRGAGAGEAFQFGASLFVWAGALRTVLVWHTTWSVNSVTHVWGYRNYATPDDSRNHPIVGFLTGGEGWHNNHHAAPSSARHGHKWWEFDLVWLTIRLLMLLGLARRVVLPPAKLGARQG